MNDPSGFFEMGGYARFVWPAFGLTLAVLAVLLWASLRRLRRTQRALRELDPEGAGRRRRSPAAGGEGEEAAR